MLRLCMKIFTLFPVLFIALSCSTGQNGYDSVFPEDRIEHIAYPVGGLGSGMFAIEGTGAISHMSLHHQPDLVNEPCMFAAIHVDGLENGTKAGKPFIVVRSGEIPIEHCYVSGNDMNLDYFVN